MTILSTLLSSVTGQSAVSGRASGASQILSGGQQGGQSRSGSAVANISATLDAAKRNIGKQQILASAALRIQGIAQGTIQPQETWEQVAGFLAITGQPFTYNVDDATGQINVTPQTLDDLSFVTPGQRNRMRDTLERLAEVRKQVDERDTKVGLRNRLRAAVKRIGELKKFSPPQALWEREFQAIKSTGRPTLVGLSPTGEVRAINQLESNFDYVEDPNKRLILQRAGQELRNILTGVSSATKSWQYTALGNKVAKDDYFLDLNERNEVVVRRNADRRSASSTDLVFRRPTKDFHIIPEFLRESRDENRIFRAPWEEQAATFIRAKKPFNLELFGDRVVVRETNFVSARRQDLLDFTQGARKSGQALVSVIT